MLRIRPFKELNFQRETISHPPYLSNILLKKKKNMTEFSFPT